MSIGDMPKRENVYVIHVEKSTIVPKPLKQQVNSNMNKGQHVITYISVKIHIGRMHTVCLRYVRHQDDLR